MDRQDTIITIDGPAGAGKGTVAKIVASRLGYTYLDTGAMYRALALAVSESGTDPGDTERILTLMRELSISFQNQKTGEIYVLLNGRNVENMIRTSKISSLSSVIARDRSVREYMGNLQKQLGKDGKIVAEGRDMGTYIFPEARFKFYLDASPEERAVRRQKQLLEKGYVLSLDHIKDALSRRDRQDAERKESPLHPAPNAVIINTTELSISEVVDIIIDTVSEG